MVSLRPLFARCLPLLLSLAVLVQAFGGGSAFSARMPGQDLETALAMLCTPGGAQDPSEKAPATHGLSCCLLQCRFDPVGGSGPLPEALVWSKARSEGRVDYAADRSLRFAIAEVRPHQPRAPPTA